MSNDVRSGVHECAPGGRHAATHYWSSKELNSISLPGRFHKATDTYSGAGVPLARNSVELSVPAEDVVVLGLE